MVACLILCAPGITNVGTCFPTCPMFIGLDMLGKMSPRLESRGALERSGRGGPPVAEPGPGDGEVVEGDDPVGEDLVGVASLAGDQHGVAGPGVGQRGLDRPPAVGL